MTETTSELSITKNMEITWPDYTIKQKDVIQSAILAKANEAKAAFEFDSKNLKHDRDVRANANKLIKETNKRRTEISKAFRQTGNDLKAEVDAMLKPLQDVIDLMDEQIKVIDNAERDDKQERIYKQIIVPTYSSRGLDPADAPIDDKWLKKTISDKQILKDVANYADIASEEAKRKGSWINHDGNIVNAYGEKSPIQPRTLKVTYYGDANEIENTVLNLNSNVNVINIDFE